MTDATEVSEVIRQLVTNAGEILGAKLAMELKAAVPDWSAKNYGACSLRAFIVAHVNGVVVAGRSGMDVIYRPSTEPARASTTPASELSSDAWRVWVSPSSPFALAFNTVDGSTLVLKRTDEVPDGHELVEPATLDEHRAIARDYLDHVPGSVNDLLRGIVESPEPQWWRRWLSEMKKLGQLATWNSFRHERLRDLLKNRLKAAGFDQTVQEVAAGAVAPRHTPHPRQTRVRETRTVGGVRAIVASVIGRMSDEELRDLKLPVGLVLDILHEKKP